MNRDKGRPLNQPRELTITPDVNMYAEGSALIETGRTKIICAASVEDGVPPFLKGQGTGWVSAEYGMLPRATSTRNRRERNKVGGRTLEIQRLIGRSLRSIVDFQALGERTIWVDCDVIQADGGTRTAAITGGYVAMVLALRKLRNENALPGETFPVTRQVAAISLGIVRGELMLDLDYSEDSAADVDLNVIMTDDRRIIELQGTAEKEPFSRRDLDQMLDLAEEGLAQHFSKQLTALGGEIG